MQRWGQRTTLRLVLEEVNHIFSVINDFGNFFDTIETSRYPADLVVVKGACAFHITILSRHIRENCGNIIGEMEKMKMNLCYNFYDFTEICPKP